MFTLRAFLLAFVSAATLTQALSLRNALAEVPSNASYVALDQVGGWLVSFTKEGKEISRHLVGKAANSTTHEKRVSGSCTPLSPTGLRAGRIHPLLMLDFLLILRFSSCWMAHASRFRSKHLEFRELYSSD
jgi:hypothetical protein